MSVMAYSRTETMNVMVYMEIMKMMNVMVYSRKNLEIMNVMVHSRTRHGAGTTLIVLFIVLSRNKGCMLAFIRTCIRAKARSCVLSQP